MYTGVRKVEWGDLSVSCWFRGAAPCPTPGPTQVSPAMSSSQSGHGGSWFSVLSRLCVPWPELVILLPPVSDLILARIRCCIIFPIPYRWNPNVPLSWSFIIGFSRLVVAGFQVLMWKDSFDVTVESVWRQFLSGSSWKKIKLQSHWVALYNHLFCNFPFGEGHSITKLIF